MDDIVNLLCFVDMRYYLFRKLFSVTVHILLYVVQGHDDGLLHLRQELLRFLNLCNRELKLCSLHNALISHHLLSFLFCDNFLRLLFAFRI